MDIPDDQRGMRIFATVGAIIEREKDGETEIVLQVREKRGCEESKKRYNGCFELPGGHIDEGEDLLEALKREVKEECGLDVTEIKSINETDTCKFLHHGKVYTPFCVN
ncbi:MAG: NUDIX hydrolase, partial [Candidatus Aenigmarchaeota archaeon]